MRKILSIVISMPCSTRLKKESPLTLRALKLNALDERLSFASEIRSHRSATLTGVAWTWHGQRLKGVHLRITTAITITYSILPAAVPHSSRCAYDSSLQLEF